MRSCNFEKISLFSAVTGEIHLACVLQGGRATATLAACFLKTWMVAAAAAAAPRRRW
jgi:hypothetical protein